jgi:bis(5'-nucleosyl)-tetraphosphatase (symmetrical)
MTTYVIGDLQGCFRSLKALLALLNFDSKRERLWFAGDLVNRGPDSLGCLRFVRDLEGAAICVLGNHDLHLLAVAHGVRARGAYDAMQDVLDAPDAPELCDWLRMRPLLHVEGQVALVHATVPPEWNPETAITATHEVELRLRGPDFKSLLQNMYGDTPSRWSDATDAIERNRFTINAFTRARCFDASGKMNLRFKGPPEELPTGFRPWYDLIHPAWRGKTILAGHWSAAGIRKGPGYVTVDSGCVWGGSLTAYCIETGKITSVPCAPGDQASTAE